MITQTATPLKEKKKKINLDYHQCLLTVHMSFHHFILLQGNYN